MTEMHQASQQEVLDLIKKVRMDPRANNRPVLGVNMIALHAAQNGGFPKHMYHPTLLPVVVLGVEEQSAVEGLGYTPHYTRHEYPRYLHRRNTDSKFANSEQVESVVAQSEVTEKLLRSKKAPNTAGPWCTSVTDIDPLPEAATEDPAIIQARLEAQIEELRKQIPARTAKG